MQWIDRFLKTQYSQLEPREALQHPPDILLGVSNEAREQLRKLEIRSVFDLALSGIFANANKLLRSMEDPTDALTRYGTAPSDIIDQTVQIEEAASLPTMDIQVLAGIGPINGPLIAEALDVVTVRDLALWPPYLAAQTIFQEAFSPEQAPGYDPESPPDLLPKSGVYPTERVFYSTIVLDEIIDDVSKLSPLENAGPIDISPSINANFGFKKPAIGAILTFSQTWFTQGVTLGQLLHSVALAPGESTRIAMIDWSRRSGVSVDESIQETEALSNTTGHNRSISEVTQAVAREAQSGFSNTSADSFSIEAGAAVGGLFGPVLGGASVGTAYSTSNATSFSSSSGRRDLSASMSQNIMDNTQQYANSARNRRASVIKEVSQSESEKVTTRVVTNYNHMHALSVQYYEVVQLYRVVVQLSEVEKCLFIPMKLIDFRNTALIAKYRHVLAAYALSGRIRRLLEPDPDTITLRAATVTGSIIGSSGSTGLPPRPPSRNSMAWGGGTPPPGRPANGFTGKWHMDQLEQLSLKIGRNILDPSGVLKLPAEMQLAGLRYNTNLIILDRLEIIRRSTGSITMPLNTPEYDMFQEPIPLSDIVSLDILNKPKTEDDHVDITLKLIYKGEMIYLDVPFFIPMQPAESTVAEFSSSQIGEGEIADHLMTNQLHYSQAIWRNLDAATLALLLSPYKYSNKPVTQIIDPVPVTVAGNFAVFRIHADPVTDTSWAKWLKEHGINRSIVKQEIVPLPSGGVFAEAVLGRYNSAEKLDMTRFWNWQDSPIPHEATAIAPIQTGSRSEPDDTKPGNFSQPLVNIVNPTSLPDPQGMAAVLQSISNGNMFRDMSGLAATIGLAQAGLNATSAAAGRAASQAGANMATFAEFQVEMVKTLLPLIGAAMGVPIPPNTSPTNISNDGAKINQGAKMDQKKTPASGGTGSGGTGAPSGGGSTGGAGKGGTTGGPSPSPAPAPVPALGSSSSYEADAFQSSLGGSGGPAMLGLLSGILQTILSATPPAGSTAETKPELKLGDKVPNKSEADAVGAIDKKVKRNTPEFDALVKNENSDIVFKDEEGTDADRMMTPRMKEKLDTLAELVKKEWPELKLRVTEVWDEDNEHSKESTHYEGRGADLTISDRDGKKLGRLAQLAVDAGFDWVFYEDSSHVHASVKKEDAE